MTEAIDRHKTASQLGAWRQFDLVHETNEDIVEHTNNVLIKAARTIQEQGRYALERLCPLSRRAHLKDGLQFVNKRGRIRH